METESPGAGSQVDRQIQVQASPTGARIDRSFFFENMTETPPPEVASFSSVRLSSES
jgi:hypothetical protein